MYSSRSARASRSDWKTATLYLGDVVVAKGTKQTAESVAADIAAAKEGLAEQLRAFVTNTFEYIGRDSELLVEGIRLPALQTGLAGRHVLVVARGYRYHEDLQALRSYIREFKPVIIGVDGGANALIEAGYWPNMIVGDMDSVSDKALKSGAEIVVHAYRNGHAPGLPRVQDLGLKSVTCPSDGTSEDVAVLLADAAGANLIVTVGMRFGLVEFLDKGRSGMASAVLTRLRVGDKIVDAKGVSRLYQSRISSKSLHPSRHCRPIAGGCADLDPRWQVVLRISQPGAAPGVVLANWTVLVIDFRYHLVSIIAVFLALAVGLTVGATALSGLAEKALKAELRKVNQHDSALTKDNRGLADQVNAAQSLGQANSQRILGGILAGQKVVLVVAPGADPTVTANVTSALGQAGATVTGQVNLSQSFLDTSGRNESILSDLAQRLHTTANVTLPADPANSAVAGQQAAAAVLSAAILTKDSAQGRGLSTSTGLPASAIASIFAGFNQLGFLSVTGPNGSTSLAPATLAVLIVPAGPAGGRQHEPRRGPGAASRGAGTQGSRRRHSDGRTDRVPSPVTARSVRRTQPVRSRPSTGRTPRSARSWWRRRLTSR